MPHNPEIISDTFPNERNNIAEETQELLEKQKIWLEMQQKVDEFVDPMGFPIDSKVKETCVAFQVNGFPVANACEGHLGSQERNHSSYLLPYITISFGRGIGEKNTYSPEEAKRRNSELLNRLNQLIDEFYKDRTVAENVRLQLYWIQEDEAIWLSSQDPDMGIARQDVSEEKWLELGKRLEEYQNEISSFTEFLKKYFIQH